MAPMAMLDMVNSGLTILPYMVSIFDISYPMQPLKVTVLISLEVNVWMGMLITLSLDTLHINSIKKRYPEMHPTV